MKIDVNINLFESLMNSISKRGYKKTIEILTFKNDDHVTLRKKRDKEIVSEILKAFNISKDYLFYSRYERGDLKYAIGLCVFYLYQEKTLGEIHKTIFMNKNKAQLSKYRQLILDLDPKFEQDKKYIEIKTELDKILNINIKN